MERKRRREKRSEVALGKSQGVYKKERFFRGGVWGGEAPPPHRDAKSGIFPRLLGGQGHPVWKKPYVLHHGEERG